jgi:hypothetical protein
MPRCLLLCVFIATIAVAESSSPFGLASADGLSGYPRLPSSDVLEVGVFRIQGMFEYIDVDGRGNMIRLPLNVGYGWFDNVEVAAGIPLYLSDNAWSEGVLGNLLVSGAWKYETARGGSTLRLSGGVSIPTGAEQRDPDVEAFLGASTSTTFRLFRLSAEAKYVLDSSHDSMRFSLGGASYVTGDIVVHGSLSGSTVGEMNLTGGLAVSPGESVSLTGSATVGLDGPWDFILSAGLAWTGLRF